MSDVSWRAGGTGQLLVGRQGSLGRVRLNRPQALNALTTPMVVALGRALDELVTAGASAIWLDGAGTRGLCAGGDVRMVRESVLGDGVAAREFFRCEYATDAAVAACPVPVVAWMDGVVMGGGVGISAHARHRLVGERTRLAMPETRIGFFPDVGALHLLARAPAGTGARLALTGEAVGGADAVALGLADRLVTDVDVEALLAGLPDCSTTAEVAALVAAAGWGADDVAGPLSREAPELAPLLAGDDPVALHRRLVEGGSTARAVAEEVAGRSPWAVAVTLAALRQAERLPDLTAQLAADTRLAPRMAAHPDFAEGVRAQLVDKDRRPRWAHAHLGEVDPSAVAAALSG